MQSLALELLIFADNIRRGEDRTEQLRLALVASGDYDPTKLVPGGVNVISAQQERRGLTTTQRPKDSVLVDESTDPNAVEDYSEVQWESPSSAGAEEVMNDLERFNAAMAANQNITIGGEDEGGEWL